MATIKLEGQWPWIPCELQQFVDAGWSVFTKNISMFAYISTYHVLKWWYIITHISSSENELFATF